MGNDDNRERDADNPLTESPYVGNDDYDVMSHDGFRNNAHSHNQDDLYSHAMGHNHIESVYDGMTRGPKTATDDDEYASSSRVNGYGNFESKQTTDENAYDVTSRWFESVKMYKGMIVTFVKILCPGLNDRWQLYCFILFVCLFACW